MAVVAVSKGISVNIMHLIASVLFSIKMLMDGENRNKNKLYCLPSVETLGMNLSVVPTLQRASNEFGVQMSGCADVVVIGGFCVL